MSFLFENLDVYNQSTEFVVEIDNICREIRHETIKDQLKRASLSIPLNIAEGNGRNTVKEKIQFYKTARGSLFECIPLMKVCMRLNYISIDKHRHLYDFAENIGKMLNGLIRSLGN